jgi:hypothetical protein
MNAIKNDLYTFFKFILIFIDYSFYLSNHIKKIYVKFYQFPLDHLFLSLLDLPNDIFLSYFSFESVVFLWSFLADS